MKIIVCVKQVPDSEAHLVARDGKPDWGDAPLVINPWDEFAVEAALQLVESHGGDAVVLSVGSESAKESLRHAMAMGCAKAVLVSDPMIVQPDSMATARILKAAVERIMAEEGPVNLIFFGRQAIDTDTGLTSIQTARMFGWPSLSLVNKIVEVNPETNELRVERNTEEGFQVVKSRLPAVISVVKDIAEPRYPSFMGIRKANRVEIPVWSLDDLSMEAPQPVVEWPEVIEPPKRDQETEMVTGASVEEIAARLVDKILAEKVL